MSHALVRRNRTARLPDGARIETTPTGEKVAHWVDGKGKACSATMEWKRIIIGAGDWAVRMVDASGKYTTIGLHTTNKVVAEQKATKLASEAHSIRAGLVDPRTEKMRTEGARPVMDHLTEYRQVLENRGNDDRYVRDCHTMIKRVIEDTGAMRLLDITEDRLIAAIVKMVDDRRVSQPPALISAARRNAHIIAAKGLTSWAAADDRIALDPLRNLGNKQWNVKADRRTVRRELLPDELARLIEATRVGRKHHGISAADRVILYSLAFGTGLRRGELSSLTVGSFNLDAKLPTVTVKAGYTKNGEEAVQPLGPDVVAILRQHMALKTPATPLFPDLTEDSADMLRMDLKAARATWVAEVEGEERARREQDLDFLKAVDSNGKKADFHGARHTYISNVVSGGASIRVAQTLARHSDPKLTLNIYSHARMFDLAGAVPALPVMALPAATLAVAG